MITPGESSARSQWEDTYRRQRRQKSLCREQRHRRHQETRGQWSLNHITDNTRPDKCARWRASGEVASRLTYQLHKLQNELGRLQRKRRLLANAMQGVPLYHRNVRPADYYAATSWYCQHIERAKQLYYRAQSEAIQSAALDLSQRLSQKLYAFQWAHGRRFWH